MYNITEIDYTISPQLALDLAFAKGRQKKWALEKVLLNVLYSTKKGYASYLKFKDISIADLSAESETEEEYILKFGYLFQIPRTEVELHVNKKTGALYLTKEGIGYGYDTVEEQIINFILFQKKKGNLCYHTNLNNNEFKI